jgi:protein TonB
VGRFTARRARIRAPTTAGTESARETGVRTGGRAGVRRGVQVTDHDSELRPDRGAPGAVPATQPAGAGDALLARLERNAAEEARRRRKLGRMIAIAAAVHLVALAVRLPEVEREREVVTARVVAKLAPTPILRQEPKPEPKPKPKPEKKIPVPDPTPVEPEPPTPAEPEPVPVATPYALVQGDVVPPRKIHAPHPPYPEVARRARRQGTVKLELLVERDGTISAVEATSDVGFGLEESALRTVSSWKLEPALLHGEPVPVRYLLNIRFELDGARVG